jgi:hypothetical protein
MSEDHVTGIVTVGIVLALYFLPWIIANHRHHPQQTPIFALNLLLGWTLIGWVIAIVWALTAFPVPKRPASYAELSTEERLPCPFALKRSFRKQWPAGFVGGICRRVGHASCGGEPNKDQHLVGRCLTTISIFVA